MILVSCLCGLHVLCIVALALSSLNLMLIWAEFAILMFSLVHCFKLHVGLLPQSIIACVYDGETWFLDLNKTQEIQVTLPQAFISRYLIILNFREVCSKKWRHLVLCRDALSSTQFRQLTITLHRQF